MGNPPDPFLVFSHAAGFVKGCLFIREKAHLAQSEREMVFPLLVLEAFAIELLLKCLLIIESVIPPNTHRLDRLFQGLAPATQDRLCRRWDENYRPRLEQLGNKLNLPTDLPGALAKCSGAFQILRYAYESPGRAHFYLGDLPDLLMREIAELKPNWVHLEYSDQP